jgi:hypothetical protein
MVASYCVYAGFSNLINVVLTFEPEESAGLLLDCVYECAVCVAAACAKS